MEKPDNTSKELITKVLLINDKLLFRGVARNNGPVFIDYTPPYGSNEGFTSLEMLLLSLSSCIGSAVLVLLRNMKKTIIGCEIQSNGIRKDEHPTGFKSIIIEIVLVSADTSGEDLDRVIMLSEEKYCPVWAMMKGNVQIEVKYRILKEMPE